MATLTTVEYRHELLASAAGLAAALLDRIVVAAGLLIPASAKPRAVAILHGPDGAT